MRSPQVRSIVPCGTLIAAIKKSSAKTYRGKSGRAAQANDKSRRRQPRFVLIEKWENTLNLSHGMFAITTQEEQ